MYLFRTTLCLLCITAAALTSGCGTDDSNDGAQLDTRLTAMIDEQGLTGLPNVEVPLDKSAPLVKLGRTLYFEKAVSGESDTACSTCHLPSWGLQNALPLPMGPGGRGTGPGRLWGDATRTLQWRNSPSIVNRALPIWKALTYGSQVHLNAANKPAGVPVVYPLDSVTSGTMGMLEIQAHFPPTGRDNMVGLPNAQNSLNQGDDLQIKSFNFQDPQYASPLDFVKDIWGKLTMKILKYPEYRQMFADAYPGVDPATYSFLNIGRAIAAFESTYFVFQNSPWERYLRGDRTAMTSAQKEGAELFFTRGCASCHSGPLLSDQAHHNIGAPLFGPGPQPVQLVTSNLELNDIAKSIGFPIPPAENQGPHVDFGVAELEHDAALQADLFAVRTASLHNVELTGPYFHNGTYQDLKSVVLHHLDAAGAVDRFDATYLKNWLDTVNGPSADHPELRAMKSAVAMAKLKSTIDPRVMKGAIQLSDAEVDKVVEFLKALTDPALKELPKTIGDVTTPSKLPIDM